MNTTSLNDTAHTGTNASALAVGELFHTAPRSMSVLFAAVAVVVVGTGIIALF